MKLNLGCGTDYREGWENLDNNHNVHADIHAEMIHFLENLPDNSFENGNIWLCKAPCEDKALEFELIDRAFFWLNFASKSLKKVEVGK